MARVTQCERVVEYMQTFGSITQHDAMKDLGVMRLASRISHLRKRGYRISVIQDSGKNRYGEKTTYARYSLEDKA